MILNTDGTKPIYLQIAEWIENEILNGDLPEDEKVYSQYKLADMYNINPATAAKGLTKLAEEGILYDKRGIGKFVSSEAIKIIKDKRINHTLKSMVEDLIQEAERLDMAETELISLIKETRSRNKGGIRMNIIECRQLTKAYRGFKALDQLCCTIGENKLVGLVGRNGAGKTTLMKILSGMLKETSGEVKVFSNRPFNSLLVSANSIFIDDQMNFPTALSLADILVEAGEFYEHWNEELAWHLFDYFGFHKKEYHKNLSKGKESTFNMIVGLAARCPLTIFDEPTTGMDAAVRKDFYRILLKDYLAYPRTILLSTHHLEEVEDQLEEVLLLDQGEKVLHMSIEELRELAIGLKGKREILAPYFADRKTIYTEPFGMGDEYIVTRNNFSQKEKQEMKREGIQFSGVSASDLCIYLTSSESQKGGTLDDILN